MPGFWGGIARDSGIAGGGGLGQISPSLHLERYKEEYSVKGGHQEQKDGEKNSVGMSLLRNLSQF